MKKRAYKDLKELSITLKSIMDCSDIITNDNYQDVKSRMKFLISHANNDLIDLLMEYLDDEEDVNAKYLLNKTKRNLLALEMTCLDRIDPSKFDYNVILAFRGKIFKWVEYYYKIAADLMRDYYPDRECEDKQPNIINISSDDVVNKNNIIVQENVIVPESKIVQENKLYDLSYLTDDYKENSDSLVKDFKIDLYTVCWNEIDLAPFVVDYWKRFVRHAYVFDNESDDGTVEYLKQFDWITVIPFNTNNTMNDKTNIDIKNNVWKHSIGKSDFVVVVDFDECLYSDDMDKELHYMIDNDESICLPSWYWMRGTRKPKHSNKKLLHEQINKCVGDGGRCKAQLFNINKINEINYEIGCHDYHPVPGKQKTYDGNNMFCLHFDKCFGENYNLKRKQILSKRLSKLNKMNGWGIHYSFSEEKIREDYKKELENSFDIIPIINSKK
jgi:hypothetical protein